MDKKIAEIKQDQAQLMMRVDLLLAKFKIIQGRVEELYAIPAFAKDAGIDKPSGNVVVDGCDTDADGKSADVDQEENYDASCSGVVESNDDK